MQTPPTLVARSMTATRLPIFAAEERDLLTGGAGTDNDEGIQPCRLLT